MNQTDTHISVELVSASTLHRAPHWGGNKVRAACWNIHLHHLLSHHFVHNISYSCLFKPLHLAAAWILVGDFVPEWWAVLSIPESVQSPAWILQSSREQRSSRVSWVIVAQVQLSQMGGVGAQSWGQRSTAFLCDQAARQATHTHTHKLLYLFWLRAVHTKVTTFIKRIHSIWRTRREEDKENRKRKWGDDIITDIRTSLTWMWNRILNKCSFLNSYNSMRYCSVRVRSVPDVFGTLRPFLHRF